ncbi:nudC domain-containing protein 3 isoform X1 [Bacillus rossius redtenbacheri]|uniref:nudC domain-containing protein 3 isoform X1 n=1 Tax=Bacillus rossius redtenbacheri TaxID=93214 RepID=UPI002FDE6624
MALDKFDEILNNICKEVVCIETFLDAVFGYLCRRTDFFSVSEAVGAGEAREVTLKALEKWQQLARERDKHEEELRERLQSDGVAPAAASEVEVPSDEAAGEARSRAEGPKASPPASCPPETPSAAPVAPSPPGEDDRRYYAADSKCYNGAVRDTYSWAQSITDVDIVVPVPRGVTKGRQVRVTATAASLEVCALHGGEWRALAAGELRWKVRPAQTLWSLEPGAQVQVHLEKLEERWWDALLASEPRIDMAAIDASRPVEDLGQDVEMKLQEAVWNQRRRQEGLPTSDQLAHARILKEAWDKEGSPFAGTPYDPSVLSCGPGK